MSDARLALSVLYDPASGEKLKKKRKKNHKFNFFRKKGHIFEFTWAVKVVYDFRNQI
jgi:hypothetical protein